MSRRGLMTLLSGLWRGCHVVPVCGDAQFGSDTRGRWSEPHHELLMLGTWMLDGLTAGCDRELAGFG